MEEYELTQEVQRFTTRFSERIAQAAEGLEESPNPKVRDKHALRRVIAYESSAIEIATGPFAEISLLDMIVFVRLCRTVLNSHWIPELYGDEGQELSDAFAKSEEELSGIAERALGAQRTADVAKLVDDWLAENPSQVRVEGIRLSDFASGAARAAADRRQAAKGILSSVKTATETANQAMLLAERAMFLVHRLPSVWRLQARLSAREIMSDLAEGSQAPLARVRQRASHLAKSGALAAGLLGLAGFAVRRLWR
jgi:hypothetical protein